MKIGEIEQLVKIIREARISELTVSADGATVKLRKPLVARSAAQTPTVQSGMPAPAVEPEPVPDSESRGTYITAPMVGIFHSIDGLSSTGSVVKSGQAVGAIESMKLMNDVVSPYDGIVVEVLVDDGTPVEYGQNLFKLETV